MKGYKNKSSSSSNRLKINQFFVLLYDRVPNLNYFVSIENLLNNANVLLVGTSKNPATTLYSETASPKMF